MKKLIKNNLILFCLPFLPVFFFLVGFIVNEDLSTGGAEWDFYLTWPIIMGYSNFDFSTNLTTHMPLHYMMLSSINAIFNNQYVVRLIYYFFSFFLPLFLYLNLKQIYKQNKTLMIIFSSSFLLIPFFRATAIWPNSHLTAIIFLLIGNYYYLKAKETNKFKYKIANLLFLSFSIYCIQTYLILFLYYLYNYLIFEKINNFIKLFLFSTLLSIPGFLFILLNPRTISVGNFITHDIFYTISSNFSLIFFFLLFLILNQKNLTIVLDKIKSLNKKEIIIIMFLVFIVFYNQQNFALDTRLRGGGFFYKLSYLIFKNNLIFIISFLLGMIISYILIKCEKKIFYILLIMNMMSINFIVYQKYFEPLFLILMSILFKNFLINNILSNLKNTLTFYALIMLYFLMACINNFGRITLPIA